jgi:2-oxoglutarate ferredoxin oxidoreductase subunit beta
MRASLKSYFRTGKLPHFLCPGCGHGAIMGALVRAIDQLGLDRNNVVVISGIGCAGRSSSFMDFNTLHTTHGRALAFATGLKLANPDLDIFVFMGDGDSSAIGGNHLIHAARRNIDLNAIVANNSIYGMTGGQYSPTTPEGMFSTTAPYGNIEPPMDIAGVTAAAGASYVARWSVFHIKQVIKSIVEGYNNKGFSLIEVISQCPTYFGRKNRLGSPSRMIQWQKERSVTLSKAREMNEEELKDKFVVGVIARREREEFSKKIYSLMR